MDKTAESIHPLRRVGRPKKVESETVQANPAQDLAMRIWAGQSDVVPYKERVERIQRGLEAQGYMFNGVVLPNA